MGRILSIVLFISFALSILGGVHYYLYIRLVRDLKLPDPWRMISTATLLSLAATVPIALIFQRAANPVLRNVLSWPGYLWMGFFFYLFASLVAGELVRGLWILGGLALPRAAWFGPEFQLRSARILALAAGCIALVLGGAALVSGRKFPEVRKVAVPLAEWPTRLDGTTIVQITDLHVGWFFRRQFVERVVDTVNSLQPDLVVITGDLVDGDVAALRDDIAPLARLRARHGVYFVTGNHEYYSGAAQWLAYLPTLKIRVLENQRVTLGEGGDAFELVGVNDSGSGHTADDQGHRADLARALSGFDGTRPTVLLAHQPKEADNAASHGVSLMLSGHTHGGQIWPWTYLVSLNQPYTEGLHIHGDRTSVYVSRGTGHWGPPMRLFAPAEITQIVVRAVPGTVRLARRGTKR